MDKPCAIQADFADFRRVKGRKVLQLFFEIPLEQSEEALRVLGHPTVGESKWCAIALLDLSKPSAASETQAAPTKDRRPFSSLPLSQQAALKCADADFQRWLIVENEDAAAVKVRRLCDIESRSELDKRENMSAREAWFGLLDSFDTWLTDQRYAGSKR